jgi:hypothetical protein
MIANNIVSFSVANKGSSSSVALLEQLQDKLVAFDASKPLRKRPRFF